MQSTTKNDSGPGPKESRVCCASLIPAPLLWGDEGQKQEPCALTGQGDSNTKSNGEEMSEGGKYLSSFLKLAADFFFL